MTLTLPPRPNLEHLKKQARALLRACQAGDPTSLRRLQTHHPLFSDSMNSHRRPASYRLADMLLVLAREYGFLSWARLKAHLESLTNQPIPAAPREVFGMVVTPDGKPVANATVSWIEYTPRRTRQRQVTMTDREGRFHFFEVRPELGDPFSVVLMVQAGKQGLSFQARRASPMVFTLQPQTTLRVAFTDANGRPLSTLAVRIRHLYEKERGALELPEDVPGPWQQRTDAKGECVFTGLPQGAQVQCAIEDERFAMPGMEDALLLTESAGGQPIVLSLLPGGVLQGRVTLAADGKPAEGIYVGAHAMGLRAGRGKAVTDAEGNYRIAHLCPGVYTVVPHLEYCPGEWEQNLTAYALTMVEVKPGVTLDRQDLTLIPGSVITGKVTDKQTGEPLEGISIGIHGPARPPSGSVTVQDFHTDSDGVYRARVPAGRQSLYITGFGRHRGRYERSREALPITIGQNAVLEQNIVLEPLSTPLPQPIRGKVVGLEGGPIANALVVPRPVILNPPGYIIAPPCETDASGMFVLDLPVASLRLCARFGNLATEKPLMAQGGDEVILQLKPDVLLTLSGQVIDASGQPISGARVSLHDWWEKQSVSILTTRTDDQGRFLFPDLFPNARYSVAVEAKGYGQAQSECMDTRLGESIELPPLTLPRADSFLAGRIMDPYGNPVVKQGIRLQGKSSRLQEGCTNTEGYFRIDGLVQEPIDLLLFVEGGGLSFLQQVQAGEADLILVKRVPSSETVGRP